MPVPSSIADLSQTAASNSPPGSESPTTADDYLRTYAAFIATLRDGKGFTDPVQLASGATTDIGGQNALFVEITGTTTITSFSTNYNGPRFLRFTGALTLTHNATTLNLPGAANIATAAGDCCIAIPNQAGNGWNVVQYQRASSPGGLVSGVEQASTSGTAIDFTGIPSWVREISIQFVGVSTNATDNLLVQLGDSGGVESAGYLGAGGDVINSGAPSVANSTGGFLLVMGATTAVLHGTLTLRLENASAFTWVASGNFGRSDVARVGWTAGSKSLSATLDRVRITSVSGTSTFDAGVINIIYK